MNNGEDIKVLGETSVDKHKNFICELPSAIYVKGLLVKYVLLEAHNFKDIIDTIQKESSELVVQPEPEVTQPSTEEPNESVA